MEIILKKNIPVNSYEAIMELEIDNSDYQFYLIVLDFVKENNYITPCMVNEKLLFRNANHVMGKRVLEFLKEHGSIEKSSICELSCEGRSLIEAENNKFYSDNDLFKFYLEKNLKNKNGTCTDTGKVFFEREWPSE